MKEKLLKIIGFNLPPERADLMAEEIIKLFNLPDEKEVIEIMGYKANRLETEEINNSSDTLIWKQGFMSCYNMLKNRGKYN